MTIIQVLNLIIDRRVRQSSLVTKNGLVVSVDETKRICVVNINGNNHPDILLQGAMGLTAGLVQIPTIGSQVKVSFLSQTSGYVSSFSELDKILIDTNLVQFNGGSLNGMVKIDAIVIKLNNLENKLNTFMNTTYNTHTHAVPSLGTSAVPIPINSGTVTVTVKSDLENLKIKQ